MDGELEDAVHRVGDGEFRGELGGLRGELGEFRGELGEFRGELGELRGELGRLRGELGGVIQQEFSPSFARLGEARATP